MSDRNDYMGTPRDFVFGPPSDEVLRATVVESNGDLTLHGPGGSKRLTRGTATWARYRRYLDALDSPTCADSVGPPEGERCDWEPDPEA